MGCYLSLPNYVFSINNLNMLFLFLLSLGLTNHGIMIIVSDPNGIMEMPKGNLEIIQ